MEHFLVCIGEAHALCSGTGEGGLLADLNLFDLRLLIEDGKHALARGKRLLERRAEVCKRDIGPEGGKRRHDRKHIGFRHDRTSCDERSADEELGCCREDDKHADRRRAGNAFCLEATLHIHESTAALVEAREPRIPCPVLDDLGQAAQVVEDIA